MFPDGNYYVLFEPGNAGVLATASFWVGVAPIPTISEWGIAILAILVAVIGVMGGTGAERKAVGRRQLGMLLAGWLALVDTPGSVSTAAAADVAPRATLTDLIVRFDRRVETRSVPEIVDAVNASRDALLSSRLLGPSAARRLLWHEPTEYEQEIIAKYPTALLSQLFEFVVLTYDHLPDLEIVADALRRAGSIRSVEHVQAFRPAAVDPLLGLPGQSSDVSQWGLHSLFIPAAWNKTKGRATIAYLDGGLATSHGDLQSSYRPHLSRNLTTNGISSDLEDNWVFSGIPYQGHGDLPGKFRAIHNLERALRSGQIVAYLEFDRCSVVETRMRTDKVTAAAFFRLGSPGASAHSSGLPGGSWS
jgi:hypothetical protein